MRIAKIIFIALSMSALPSCSLLSDTCAQTAAVRATASALVADAQLALDQAELVIATIAPAGIRHEAFIALDAARAALRASAQVLVGIETSCDALDVSAIFSSFADAWRMLEPFLVLFGGDSATAVRAPLVVTR